MKKTHKMHQQRLLEFFFPLQITINFPQSALKLMAQDLNHTQNDGEQLITHYNLMHLYYGTFELWIWLERPRTGEP